MIDSARLNITEKLPLTIGLVGPSGTGKSTLAKKIARMITRSEHSPNVLLIDADTFGRGLTSQVEGAEEFQNETLQDVVEAKKALVVPVELRKSWIGPGDWPSLPEDGRVFFVPSSRAGSRNWQDSTSAGLSNLKLRLIGALSFAANSGRAEAIVIDTAPTPDICGGFLASICDLIILVGDKDHGEEELKEHLASLAETLQPLDAKLDGIPIEIVFNKMDANLSEAKGKCHLLPSVDELRDEIADRVELERSIAGIISPFLDRAHPGLVPSWCAALPGEWRKVANAIGGSPGNNSRLLHLFPGIAPPFLKRAAFALGIGIPAAACLLLTSSMFADESPALQSSTSAASGSGLKYVGLAIGVCFLLAAVFELFRVSVEFRTCLVAASRLGARDLDWILSCLRSKGKQTRKNLLGKGRRLHGREMDTLHRVFDALGRSIHESGRLR